jgi:hypothetical protein
MTRVVGFVGWLESNWYVYTSILKKKCRLESFLVKAMFFFISIFQVTFRFIKPTRSYQDNFVKFNDYFKEFPAITYKHCVIILFFNTLTSKLLWCYFLRIEAWLWNDKNVVQGTNVLVKIFTWKKCINETIILFIEISSFILILNCFIFLGMSSECFGFLLNK